MTLISSRNITNACPSSPHLLLRIPNTLRRLRSRLTNLLRILQHNRRHRADRHELSIDGAEQQHRRGFAQGAGVFWGLDSAAADEVRRGQEGRGEGFVDGDGDRVCGAGCGIDGAVGRLGVDVGIGMEMACIYISMAGWKLALYMWMPHELRDF